MSKDATPVAESVEVTQADRDAAAGVVVPHGRWPGFPSDFLIGRADRNELVQAFARHRLAAYEAGRAEGVLEAAEVADQIARFAKHKGLCAVVGGYGYCDCGRDAAVESLRALSKEPTK